MKSSAQPKSNRAKVTIALPLPPASLHAHAKGHWRAKAGPTAKCRALSRDAANGSEWCDISPAVLSLDFYWPDLRRRDDLNAAHSCKPYIDGLVDAGVMADDNWQTMSIGHIRSHLDRENPRVELTVEELP